MQMLMVACIDLKRCIKVAEQHDLLQVYRQKCLYGAMLLVLVNVTAFVSDQLSGVVPMADVDAVPQRKADHPGPQQPSF